MTDHDQPTSGEDDVAPDAEDPSRGDGSDLTRGLIPVVEDDTGPAEERRLVDGVALCLSGGGYRAMLFHLGGLIRLNEIGRLETIDRVSSVSGGSITAARLGLAWSALEFTSGTAGNLDELVIRPVLAMATRTIDTRSVIGGLFRPGRTIGQKVARAYDQHLYHGATLGDLPADDDGPRFVINATNVQTGKLFRFSRPYQGDYTIGLWREPETRLADAVAASSAFPPFLSPHTMAPSGRFDDRTAGEYNEDSFTDELWLSDGGAYDNLGLETAWKRYRTVLVSDGGGALRAVTRPRRNWAQHGIRMIEIVDGQVRALRKRQLIDGFERGARTGSYWSVRSDVPDYHLSDPFPFPERRREAAAEVPTRLSGLDEQTRWDLVDWGYVIADTALRRWVYPDAPRPTELPSTSFG